MFYYLIFFSVLNCLSVLSGDFSIDQDTIVGNNTIAGRLSKPEFKNDYKYLNYLSDMLYFGSLNKGGKFYELSEDHKKHLTQDLLKRMALLMVGGGTGLKKRNNDDINPDFRWQSILNIKHMALASQKFKLNIDFKNYFRTLSQNHAIKKDGISDEDYQKHLDLVSSMGIIATSLAEKEAEEGEIEADQQEAAVEALKKTNINNGIGLKGIDYCRQYGMFYNFKNNLDHDRQIQRIIDFTKFRRLKELPVRVALGVSNSTFNDQERKRFKDRSWIVCDKADVYHHINPAGSIHLRADITASGAFSNIGFPSKGVEFDEITFDTKVSHQVHDYTFARVYEAWQMLKEGGTFQAPIYLARTYPSGLNLDLKENIKDVSNKIMKENGFVEKDGHWQRKRRVATYNFFPNIDLPISLNLLKNEKIKNDLTQYLMDDLIVPFMKESLKTFHGKPFFSNVEVIKNAEHHMGIYNGPVPYLLIATK